MKHIKGGNSAYKAILDSIREEFTPYFKGEYNINKISIDRPTTSFAI
ncbi:MAG: hypothetical protein LBI72_08860 [Flavobacteriaceae bacterium]|jgi:hypothetical protein|nr:hypothetical protein [Flavobacteriaceae bacterium]